MVKEIKKKAVFIDRDGVINIERPQPICQKGDLEIYSYVPEAIKKIKNTGFLAIIITNQSVVARNLCSLEGIETIHNDLIKNLKHKGATIDHIYFCPHFPDKNLSNGNSDFLIECDCRKPKSGMLIKAAKDFNIDLSQSYMIGDAERDIECGKNAGITTIGVRTGKGLKGSKITPDHFFDNLLSAVNFITQ